jgi:thiamine kinase-like enzyme
MGNMDMEFTKGNMSEVHRDGNVVHRDIKPQSKTIHRLLRHLENKGVTFVPRFLGMSDDNREMLNFIDGETIEDYPEASDIQIRLKTVQAAAEMLREYHDATLDFIRYPEDIWFLEYEGESDKEVICHNDFAPYNVTFKDNMPVGLIDFDTACPSPRIWDVAYAVYRFVPLGSEVYDPEKKRYRRYDKALDCAERKLLLRAFLDAYGNRDIYGDMCISDVLDNVILRLRALVRLFDDECAKGNAVFIRMKEEGHQQLYINEIEFIKDNMPDWK